MADVPPIPDPSGGLKPWLAAVFISAIVALAGVIVYLFKTLEKKNRRADARSAEKDAALAEQRKDAAVKDEQWETKLEKLRADYEVKNKELAEKYAQDLRVLAQQHKEDLRTLYDASREHEDQVRREFSEVMETVSQKAGEQSQAIASVLERFYTRFVGPRSRGGY